ncbi:MAG TPA: DUF6639 family protein [Burkholderiales bacterium]|nr:DUF6639 family protein [Burkholderiales bacterium]
MFLAVSPWGLLAGPGAVGPVPHECAAPRNTVALSSSRQDALDACQGAQAAVAFLGSQGFQVGDRIKIEVVRTLPEGAGPAAAGCFVQSGTRVLVLTYDKFKARRTWFTVPVDRRLYQSVATHEVAHALASCNFRIPAPSIQAKEYIAFVAMFATMSDSHRRKILEAFPGEGFEDESRMSAIVYMFDPPRFGVEAYRHYLRPENGPAFLRAILSGSALVD